MSEEKTNPNDQPVNSDPNQQPAQQNVPKVNETTKHYSEQFGDLINKGERAQYAKPFVNEVIQPVIPTTKPADNANTNTNSE